MKYEWTGTRGCYLSTPETDAECTALYGRVNAPPVRMLHGRPRDDAPAPPAPPPAPEPGAAHMGEPRLDADGRFVPVLALVLGKDGPLVYERNGNVIEEDADGACTVFPDTDLVGFLYDRADRVFSTRFEGASMGLDIPLEVLRYRGRHFILGSDEYLDPWECHWGPVGNVLGVLDDLGALDVVTGTVITCSLVDDVDLLSLVRAIGEGRFVRVSLNGVVRRLRAES